MSRSRRKQPFFTCVKGKKDSDRFDKTNSHRRFRRAESSSVRALLLDEGVALPIKQIEISDQWSWGSDGPKHYDRIAVKIDNTWQRK